MKKRSRLAAVTALVVTTASSLTANAGASQSSIVHSVASSALPSISTLALEAPSNTGPIVSINPRSTIDPHIVVVPRDTVAHCGCIRHFADTHHNSVHAAPERNNHVLLRGDRARHDPCICRPGDIGVSVLAVN